MKLAFVLRLGPETETARVHLVGHIEEVDTGRELRFKSTDELLRFLVQCFDEAGQLEVESKEPADE